MRRSTKKKFKRFDLLLRSDHKVCIIDWKFSKVNANQKITAASFVEKNKQYFQLARKQYNADVQLKFYCFHQKCDDRYHQYTFADYTYKADEVELMDANSESDEEDAVELKQSEKVEKVEEVALKKTHVNDENKRKNSLDYPVSKKDCQPMIKKSLSKQVADR